MQRQCALFRTGGFVVFSTNHLILTLILRHDPRPHPRLARDPSQLYVLQQCADDEASRSYLVSSVFFTAKKRKKTKKTCVVSALKNIRIIRLTTVQQMAEMTST